MSTPQNTRLSRGSNNSNTEEEDDCVVWDESGNADLRKAADPTFETPRDSDDEEASPRRRRSSLTARRIAPSSSEVKKRAKSDHEISVMWQQLQKEGSLNTTTTTTEADTPLRRNTDAAPQENRWGLVKGRRRRQEKSKPLALAAHSSDQPNNDNNHNLQALPPPNNNAKRRLSADDAFADLLERLKTPERTTMPPPHKTRKSLSSLPQKQLLPSQAKPSPDPFGPFPDIDFEALDRSIAKSNDDNNNNNKSASQKNLSQKLDTAVAPPSSSSAAVASSSTAVRPKNPYQRNQGMSTRLPPKYKPLVTQMVAPNPLDPVQSGAVPPPKVQPVVVRSSKPVPEKPVKQEEEQDPFGDFPDIDMALIDQKIQQATAAEKNKQVSKAPAATNAPVSTAAAAKKDTEEEDDPFGVFPDIDMDMIEQRIQQATQAQQKKQATISPSIKEEEDPFGAFPELDFDSIDQQIAATTAEPADEGLSRYRIVKVTDDTTNFTKTLHVAKWRDAMYAEFEDAVAIHRERGNGAYPMPQAWPVDGAVHLRGEWYYTEAEEGDFLHVYSIFGNTRTNRFPLMLDTRADPNVDDLLLILHPETLLVPTTISETIRCTRRAVLKNRLGSSGSSKYRSWKHIHSSVRLRYVLHITSGFLLTIASDQALLMGTLRHRLFEESLEHADFTPKILSDRIDRIIQEASQDIVGVPGMTSHAAKSELFKVVPQVKRFVDEFTSFGKARAQNLVQLDSVSAQPPVYFRATGVHAIEETINSPEMGIKGNIDAVLHARVSDTLQKPPTEALVGVELKTSHNQRVDNSHMAQLALYNLMLRARTEASKMKKKNATRNIVASETSILLYLNAEAVKVGSMSLSVSDIKSLIGQRNMVATKQKQASALRGIEIKVEADSTWPKVKILAPQPPNLPAVENGRVCEKCYMARECTLYASLEKKQDIAIPDTGAYPELLQKHTGHLSAEELGYFATWDRLIDFEASAMIRPVAMKWLRPSSDLEASGAKTVSSLVIKKIETPAQSQDGNDDTMLMTLARSSGAPRQTAISSLGLAADSYAIVSIDDTTVGNSRKNRWSRMYLARGIVRETTPDCIVLRVSESDVKRIQRTLDEASDGDAPTLRLDRDEIATGLGTLRRNLINLLTGDKGEIALENPFYKRLPRLREFILRRKEPSYLGNARQTMFSPPPNKLVPHVPGLAMMDMAVEFAEMNADQKCAVEKVITAQDYTLIQGLPGTGKTHTISFILRLLVAHGKRILITSYTHSAVDNVLLKLIQAGFDAPQSDGTRALLRVGDCNRCHADVKHLLVENMAREVQGTEKCSLSTETIRHCVRRARVVGVTALTIPRSPLLAGEQFDVVIVDEAGQISQPAIIGALMAADSFILVGDHMQLPPLVSSELAEQGGFGVSLLKRLADAHPKHVVQLTYQYRMAQDICTLTNDIAYEGKLKCATEAIRRRRLDIPNFPGNTSPSVYTRAIDPSKTVVFLDTDQCKPGSKELLPLETTGGRDGGGLVNKTEATIVERIVEVLISFNVSPRSIGIICPFNAQLKLIESSPQVLKWRSQGLECSTIDRYQGRDKPVIILSFVRSNNKGKVGRLLGDFRRLNVAASRAECKLIMIGSLSTLKEGSKPLRPALERLDTNGKIIRVAG